MFFVVLPDAPLGGPAVASTESGFLKPAADRSLELLLTHPMGYSEIWDGKVEVTGLVQDTITGARIELRTDVVARTPEAKHYTAGHRLYGLVNGELMWTFDMAAMGEPLQNHLAASMATSTPEARTRDLTRLAALQLWNEQLGATTDPYAKIRLGETDVMQRARDLAGQLNAPRPGLNDAVARQECARHLAEPVQAHAEGAHHALELELGDAGDEPGSMQKSGASHALQHHCPVAPDQTPAAAACSAGGDGIAHFAAPVAALGSLTRAPPVEPPAA